ncbi:MAG: alpha/beta fold hydrolase, partial [Candidatus Hydrogenedentota bacterium]
MLKGRKAFFSVLFFSAVFLFQCVAPKSYEQPVDERGESIPQEKQEYPRSGVYKGGTYSTPQNNPGADEGEALAGSSSSIPNCETPHNYANSTKDFECVFVNPNGSTGMSLHFASFETEANYDFVYLYDEDNTLITMYHGNLGSFWTENIPGSKVRLRFVSDSSITKAGFLVDKIRYGATPTTEPPPAGWQEVSVNYESSHGVTVPGSSSWSETVEIVQPGALELQLHFEKVSIDLLCMLSECQVWVEVMDGSNNILKTFKGSTYQTNFWESTTIPGDTARIKFKIVTKPWYLGGGVVNEYGFKIDKIRVKTSGPVRKFASRYPIVLHHGFGGFDTVLGIDYFFRVKDYLQRHGYEVYVTEVSPVAPLQNRTDQLAQQIDQILAKSSAKNGYTIDKVNLIGHSMGGLDARLLVSTNTTGINSGDPKDQVFGKNYGSKIATLTTIATPHKGSPIADMILNYIPGDAQKALGVILNLAMGAYNPTNISENDVLAAAYNLTEKFCTVFNQDHPEPTNLGIVYRTYAGITHDMLPIKSNSDEVDFPIMPTYEIMKSMGGNYVLNDGLVPYDSAVYKEAYHT